MAVSGQWMPTKDGLMTICGLLKLQASPLSTNAVKSRALHQLAQYYEESEFNHYLVFILAAADLGTSLDIRQAAGLLLKNRLRIGYNSMSLANQKFIKSALLYCLGAADAKIRSTVGTVISAIVKVEGFVGTDWVQIFETSLNSTNNDVVEGAMEALFKICEDSPQELISDASGFTIQPFNVFLPILFKFFESPHSSLRKLSLGSINQYIIFMPPALYMSMDQYVQGLFAISNDPDPAVRKLVCIAFIELTRAHPFFLEGYLCEMIACMLHFNNDVDEVAIEACSFWSAYCEAQLPLEYLKAFLPRLFEVLFRMLVYADDDESLIDFKDEVKTQDDAVINAWNLRECSKAALYIVSKFDLHTLHDVDVPTLPFLADLLTRDMISNGCTWKRREASILAFGILAEAFIDNHHRIGLYKIVRRLVRFLTNQHPPLVRSISCWTISRYNRIIFEIEDEVGDGILLSVAKYLLHGIRDPQKTAQVAACLAFGTLAKEAKMWGEKYRKILEDAAKKFLRSSDLILKNLVDAFKLYQVHSFRILLDAIQIVVNTVDSRINKTTIDNLMPLLIAKWQQLPNANEDLFPLFECFMSLLQVLGTSISSFVQPLFVKCIEILDLESQCQRLTKVGKEFVVYSFNLLSKLTNGYADVLESLGMDQRIKLRDLCWQYFDATDDSDVRHCAHMLIVDML